MVPLLCAHIPLMQSLAKGVKQKICKCEKLPIVIYRYPFPLSVYQQLRGESFQLITVLFQMSSLSQIKRCRQQKPMGSKTRTKNQMQQSAGEESGNEECVCVRKRKKKSDFEKLIEAGFYDKWSCVGLDGRGSKGAVCHGGRQRLFKACQPGSILSHSYLVCLDRHGTKGEGRKSQHGLNWHVE